MNTSAEFIPKKSDASTGAFIEILSEIFSLAVSRLRTPRKLSLDYAEQRRGVLKVNKEEQISSNC